MRVDKTIWERELGITSRDADFSGRSRISAILESMQTTADDHLEALGIQIDDMLRQGLAWMLMSVDLKIEELPSLHQTVKIATWNLGAQGVQWERDFRFTDDHGAEWGSARTFWTLVDLNKRRILRPSAFPHDIPILQSNDDIPDTGRSSKLVLPESLTWGSSYEWIVRYSGIDPNGHLNNTKYVELCVDSLSLEELKQMHVREFCISFIQEASFGERIRVFRTNTDSHDGLVYFCGENPEGKRLFEAKLEYDNK